MTQALPSSIPTAPTARPEAVGPGPAEWHEAEPAAQGQHLPAPWAKRPIEVALVLLMLPVWGPLLLGLMLLVRLDSRGPAVFRQCRYGKDGKVFTIFKLRSMVRDAEPQLSGHLAACVAASAEWDRSAKLRADPRLTRIGGFLRRSSLDELPQLLNVLRGEMSLVGPRPIPLEERPRYGESFKTYAAVRPGLTGLWQVSGRNDLPYGRRIALDRKYVRHRCWAMELGVWWCTVGALVTRRGAY